MRGFEFNLMVLGESGLGKSSLINSMFWTKLMTKDAENDMVQEGEGGIHRRRVILQEGEVITFSMRLMTNDNSSG